MSANEKRWIALKRVLIGVIYIPISVLFIIPIALLFGAIHVVLDAVATITTIDFIRLRSVFWSVWWDLWTWNMTNWAYIFGVGDNSTVAAHSDFRVFPSMSSTTDKLGGDD